MERKITNIKERILYYTDFKRLAKEKFFEELGVTYGNFKGKAKNQALGSDVIERIISKYPEINANWLLTGSGEMLKSDIYLSATTHTENNSTGIPLIPLDAMAGIGRGEISVLELDCERYVIPMFKGADYLIPVKGSSMIPKYNSGDVVACKKLSLQDIFFQWNKVYVLDTEQGALIKRVCKGSDKEHITLVSDNPNYEPFELHLSQIYAIAIVMGVCRLE